MVFILRPQVLCAFRCFGYAIDLEIFPYLQFATLAEPDGRYALYRVNSDVYPDPLAFEAVSSFQRGRASAKRIEYNIAFIASITLVREAHHS